MALPKVIGFYSSIVALALAIPSIVFLMALATNLLPHHNITVLTFFAGSLEFLSILPQAILSYYHLQCDDVTQQNQRSQVRWKFYFLGLILESLYLILSAAALAWMATNVEKMQPHTLGISTQSVVRTEFILWALSMLMQTIFYVWLGTLRTQSPVQDQNSSSVRQRRLPSMRDLVKTSSSKGLRSMSSREHVLKSPPHSPALSDVFSSLRSSFSNVGRPSSSRSKYPRLSDGHGRHSMDHSSDNYTREMMIKEDGFDTWDSSSVGPYMRGQIREYASALDPIPGSRPETPLNAMGGPFVTYSDSRPSSAHGSRNAFSRPQSRARSTTNNEEDVHPIFRSDSPLPPPTPTPGTVITASPTAGQTIDRRALNRMRSSSFPTHPSPLVHSTRSTDSLGRVQELPAPPARAITPPIPDFILAAGSRSSLVGYGKRKEVSLRRPSESEEAK